MKSSAIRSRWAALGAAVAISLGAGGVGITHATISSGERAVFVPLDDPCRLASTRPAPNTVGPRTTGIGPEESYTLDGWGTEGDCTLPSGTAALALNVTAVNASQQTNLRFFPADAAVPATANLNPSPGASPTPNAVNVNLDGTGQFKVFNKFGVVEVVIDVMGYYEDHNHDDRYYQKSEVDTAVGAKANAADVYTKAEADAAHDLKADVADVYTKADIDLALLRRQQFVGYVGTNGTKEGTGSFTSSRSSTGVYSVSYDFTGQGIPSAWTPMVIVASPSLNCGSNPSVMADWSSTGASGGFATGMAFTVRTFDGGALADCGFSFISSFAAPNNLIPPVPAVARLDADAIVEVTCTNEDGSIVCG